MRTYVVTTGIVFALLVCAHLARIALEGVHVLGDPFFLISTLIALALCGWAWRVFRRLPRA
jgi:hypothetical protein